MEVTAVIQGDNADVEEAEITSDRVSIEESLGKDRTTIAKEIKTYSYDKKSGRPGYPV